VSSEEREQEDFYLKS